MKVQCFSNFTFSYLDRARVLFTSLRRFHPNWRLVALVTDCPPAGFELCLADEPFDAVVYAKDLAIRNFESWLFQHDLVEACTAVKGPFMHALCSGGSDAIVYLDPDTCLLGSLMPVERLLETADIILTPHQTIPETQPEAIIDNEITSLKMGVFNLGFCAIRTTGEGARFAKWWSDRLLVYGFNDIPNGLFVDQRWCDHVPGLFDHVTILRDPGYNVASWNLSNRYVDIRRDGSIMVNDAPLRFWHFTKLGPIADMMTRKYAKENFHVYEIWNWYARQIRKNNASIDPSYWAYKTYDDGRLIDARHRRLYRAQRALQNRFPNPFLTGPESYSEWLENEDLVGMIEKALPV